MTQGDTKPSPNISDTHPNTERVLIELMRKAPGWKKAHMLGQMYQTMKLLALQGLRERHPKATEAELRRYLAHILLGPDMATKVYGSIQYPENSDAH